MEFRIRFDGAMWVVQVYRGGTFSTAASFRTTTEVCKFIDETAGF